jgi:hypothetical protein
MVFLLQVAGCVLSVLAMQSSNVWAVFSDTMMGVWALPRLRVPSSLHLMYGSDAASAAQADTNIHLAWDGIWVIRAGPYHTQHNCCMEGQYCHYSCCNTSGVATLINTIPYLAKTRKWANQLFIWFYNTSRTCNLCDSPTNKIDIQLTM